MAPDRTGGTAERVSDGSSPGFLLETAGLTAVAMLAFAANSLLCRGALAAGHADAATFTTLRLASGAASLYLLGRFRRGPVERPRIAWGSAVALFAYAMGFSLAYVRIPAGVGALLLFAAVQLTMIGAGLRAGERPRPMEWTGFAVSIAGLVVLTRPGLARPDPLGAILMLGAGVAWGVYSLHGRGRGDAIGRNAGSFARATPIALLVSLGIVFAGSARVDPVGAGLAVASGALASGMGYAIWYAALRGLTATRAAIVQLSVPPLAAVGGVVLLGELFSLRLLVASLLILGGIALAVFGHRSPAAQASDEESS